MPTEKRRNKKKRKKIRLRGEKYTVGYYLSMLKQVRYPGEWVRGLGENSRKKQASKFSRTSRSFMTIVTNASCRHKGRGGGLNYFRRSKGEKKSKPGDRNRRCRKFTKKKEGGVLDTKKTGEERGGEERYETSEQASCF